MNDPHDNAQDDKAMLGKMAAADRGTIGKMSGWAPPDYREAQLLERSTLLDWVDGLDDDAATDLLMWLARNRPAVLREAKQAIGR